MGKKIFILIIAAFVILYVLFSVSLYVWPLNIVEPLNVKWNKCRIDNGHRIVSIKGNPKNGNFVYAVSKNEFFVSKDSASSFRLVMKTSASGKRLPNLLLHRIAVNTYTKTVIFALENGDNDDIVVSDFSGGKIKKIYALKGIVTDITCDEKTGEFYVATFESGVLKFPVSLKPVQIMEFENIKDLCFTSVNILPHGKLIAGLMMNSASSPLIAVWNDKDPSNMFCFCTIPGVSSCGDLTTVYCIARSSDGVYISTNSYGCALLFTTDGIHFKAADRIKKMCDPLNGIREVIPAKNSLFVSCEGGEGGSDVETFSICKINPHYYSYSFSITAHFVSSPDISYSLPIYAFDILKNGKIIAYAGDSLYMSGGNITP